MVTLSFSGSICFSSLSWELSIPTLLLTTLTEITIRAQPSRQAGTKFCSMFPDFLPFLSFR